MNPIMEAILKRRSIRKYEDRPVSKEQLTELLKAGMAGPTACNSQPWEFVVVTDPAILAKLKGKLMFAKHNAPAAIVVCGNPKVARNKACKRFWVQDCSAAIENILLAAVGMDLGTVWIGLHPVHNFESNVRRLLELPEHVTPLGMVLVGYPAEEKAPRTQYEEKRVHWQRYGIRE